LLGLQFLKTNHIWLGFGQPGQKIVQTFIDIVNVKGRDFQRSLCSRISLSFPNSLSVIQGMMGCPSDVFNSGPSPFVSLFVFQIDMPPFRAD
jgi:hypothetical protein